MPNAEHFYVTLLSSYHSGKPFLRAFYQGEQCQTRDTFKREVYPDLGGV